MISRWGLVGAVAVISFSLLGQFGCATPGPFTWVADLPPAQSSTAPIVQPRDTISIVVAGQPTLGGEFVVRDDGSILMPLLGKVPLVGLTAELASAQLVTTLKKMVVEPSVSVVIGKSATCRINVVGEVKAPGVFELVRDHSVLGALAAAGWVTDFARKDGVYVIRRGNTEPRVRFTLTDIKSAEPKSAAFQLNDGDSVVVE
jgi:polysaccharide biosynthesis/export protein